MLMNEIEKLYKNANVKKQIPKVCSSNELYCKECEAHIENAMPYCKNAEYPPFTAEKQLEIIKLISKQGRVIIENWETDSRGFNVVFRANSNLRYITFDSITRQTLEEALAQIVNDIWQNLTEEEKQQIKEILEG